MSQTEDCSPEASLSDCSESLLRRSGVFSTVFCLVRTENIKSRRPSLWFQKNQIPTYPGHQCGLGTWEGSLTVEGVMSIGVPGRRCLILVFSLFIWLLRVSATASRIFHLQPRHWNYCSMCHLFPQPGIKPRPLELRAQNLSHWTTREVPTLYFEHEHSLLLVNAPFPLVIKADAHCLSARPQTGCSSQHRIQGNSCISQNDFPRPQHVSIPFISVYQYCIPFYGQIMVHCVDGPYVIYPMMDTWVSTFRLL